MFAAVLSDLPAAASLLAVALCLAACLAVLTARLMHGAGPSEVDLLTLGIRPGRRERQGETGGGPGA